MLVPSCRKRRPWQARHAVRGLFALPLVARHVVSAHSTTPTTGGPPFSRCPALAVPPGGTVRALQGYAARSAPLRCLPSVWVAPQTHGARAHVRHVRCRPRPDACHVKVGGWSGPTAGLLLLRHHCSNAERMYVGYKQNSEGDKPGRVKARGGPGAPPRHATPKPSQHPAPAYATSCSSHGTYVHQPTVVHKSAG